MSKKNTNSMKRRLAAGRREHRARIALLRSREQGGFAKQDSLTKLPNSKSFKN